MIGVDTNIVVRLVTRDEPTQTARAEELFGAERLWLAKTVLLETEWVLRHAYRLDPNVIHDTFRKLLGFPGLEVEDRPAVLRALGWFRDGMDFADALHLASSALASRFATFDRGLVKRSTELGTQPVAEAL